MIVDPKYGPLRRHQAEALRIAREITVGSAAGGGGDGPRVITAHVTPGGGKTLLAAVMANALIDKRAIDIVIVVVPTHSLRVQMHTSFVNTKRGCTRSLRTDLAALDQGMLYPQAGYVVTYAALANKSGAALRRLQRICKGKRVLVILDEPHHLCERVIDDAAIEGEACESSAVGREWLKFVKPLVDLSLWTLLMSGTLVRHDRQRIPFVSYDDERKPIVDISYDRRAALAEHAVLPIDFEVINANAIYERYGRRHVVELKAKKTSKQKQRDAVAAVLRDRDYVEGVLRQAVEHWKGFRVSTYRGRPLVIAMNTKAARAICAFIVNELHVNARVATTAEKGAHATIRKFRETDSIDAIVTVGMAYEGLDVPEITHVVFLHPTRSIPWMAQAVERGARFDPKCGLPWEQQRCFVFCPDDPAIEAFVKHMKHLQIESCEERDSLLGAAAAREARARGSSLRVLSVETKETNFMDDSGAVVRGAEADLVRRTVEVLPAYRGRPVPEVLRAAKLLDWSKIVPVGAAE